MTLCSLYVSANEKFHVDKTPEKSGAWQTYLKGKKFITHAAMNPKPIK